MPDYEVLHLLDPDRLANQSPCRERLRRILQGGYTQSLGIINGLLLLLTLRTAGAVGTSASIGWGLLLAAILCFIGSAPPETS